MANPWENDPIVQPAGNVFTLPPSPQQQAQTAGTQVNTAHTQQQMAQQAQAFPLQQQKLMQDIANARMIAANNQKKTSDQAQQDQAKRMAAMEASRDLVRSVNHARGLVSGWSTGMGGWLGQMLPWSDQANQLQNVINQEVRGNIFNNWVSQMKAQTQGGTSGIGRIMQSEIPLVTGAQGALDPVKMGQEGTMNSLNQIEKHALRATAILNNENPDDPKILHKYQMQFLGSPKRQQQAPSGWKIERMGN